MSLSAQYFEGRTLVIATRHGKEQVIAPLAEAALKVHCIVPHSLDTDILGTFSGEVARAEDALATARKKCLMAIEATGCDLAIASEGSFGPHPSLWFIPADHELLLLYDNKNQLSIQASVWSTHTNYSSTEVNSFEALSHFASSAGFPSHALILSASGADQAEMVKGINEPEQLRYHYQMLSRRFGHVHVQTDMRAMYNPTRMEVIAQAMQQLIGKIQQCCTVCRAPGFDITEVKTGLPCTWCGQATASVLAFVYQCQCCGYQHEHIYPHGKTREDPGLCQHCNP
jgi:hypothetical protein